MKPDARHCERACRVWQSSHKSNLNFLKSGNKAGLPGLRLAMTDLYKWEVLSGLLATPKIPENKTSSWAVYQLLHTQRSFIIEKLKEAGIPSNIYYPIPLHTQPSYLECERAPSLANSESFSKQVFCLPQHAYIEKNEREYIVGVLKEIIEKL